LTNLAHRAKKAATRKRGQVKLYQSGKFSKNDEISPKRLQELASEVVSALRIQRKEIAVILGVSPSAITRATKEVGTKWAALQIRVLSTFGNLEVESKTTFRVAAVRNRD